MLFVVSLAILASMNEVPLQYYGLSHQPFIHMTVENSYLELTVFLAEALSCAKKLINNNSFVIASYRINVAVAVFHLNANMHNTEKLPECLHDILSVLNTNANTRNNPFTNIPIKQ